MRNWIRVGVPLTHTYIAEHRTTYAPANWNMAWNCGQKINVAQQHQRPIVDNSSSSTTTKTFATATNLNQLSHCGQQQPQQTNMGERSVPATMNCAVIHSATKVCYRHTKAHTRTHVCVYVCLYHNRLYDTVANTLSFLPHLHMYVCVTLITKPTKHSKQTPKTTTTNSTTTSVTWSIFRHFHG